MKRIHRMASALRQRVLRSSIRKTSERMDPTVRAALARDVAEQVEQGEVNEELEVIEQDIENAKQLLQQSEAKETFLGQRCAQYRKVLDERARLLRQEQDDLNDARKKQQLLQESSNNSTVAAAAAAAEATNDEEGNTTCDISNNNNNNAILQEQDEDLARRLEKWEKDEDALVAIVETHKQILANCEEIRRKIKELERKRTACCAMAGECRDFLDTAAKAAAKDTAATAQEVEQEASTISASLQEEEKASHDDLEMTGQNNHESSENVRHSGDDEESSLALDARSAV